MNRNAFSLVELAIALVILGLLIGGVLTGQTLIRNAELASVTSELTAHATSIQQFREEYAYYPGDFPRATEIWGATASCPGTSATPNTDRATCDGNGNNLIEQSSSSTEAWRAWQHLSNAGLIEGTFTGVPGSASPLDCVAGVNCPEGPIPASHFLLLSSLAGPAGNAGIWPGQSNNVIVFGLDIDSSQPAPIFTPEEMYNIDRKIDDGLPATGRVRTRRSLTSCHTTTVVATSRYRLDETGQNCMLLYLLSTRANVN